MEHKLVASNPAEGINLSTMDVYGDNANIIPEEIPELLPYIDEVMPRKEDNCGMKSEVLDTVIAVEDYLPQKNGFSEQNSSKHLFG